MGKFLKVFGIIIIIFGLIGSLLIASSIDYNARSRYSSGPSEDSVFVFLAGAVSSVLLGACVSAFGQLLITTEENKATTDEILRYLKRLDEKGKPNTIQYSAPYTPNSRSAYPDQNNSGDKKLQTKVCPSCGELNGKDKMFCVICGAKL